MALYQTLLYFLTLSKGIQCIGIVYAYFVWVSKGEKLSSITIHFIVVTAVIPADYTLHPGWML